MTFRSRAGPEALQGLAADGALSIPPFERLMWIRLMGYGFVPKLPCIDIVTFAYLGINIYPMLNLKVGSWQHFVGI